MSPTYAWEVSGHGAIAPHVGKFHGIRNGIDADIWDPLGDDFLPVSTFRRAEFCASLIFPWRSEAT